LKLNPIFDECIKVIEKAKEKAQKVERIEKEPEIFI
jgi:hypothetical protein